jgi:anti-sigma B factor antagonist
MRSDFENDRTANIHVGQRDGAVIIRISGHIDESAADALNTELNEILDAGRKRIIFELSDVTFMGSSGLGQIMRAYREVRNSEGYVRVVNPQPLIEDLFDLTKLNKIMTIHPTVEDALQGGQQSGQ